MELKICHLYPDVLNLYGDGGNIRCMQQRLIWRGLGAEVTKMPLGTTTSLAGYDIVLSSRSCSTTSTAAATARSARRRATASCFSRSAAATR